MQLILINKSLGRIEGILRIVMTQLQGLQSTRCLDFHREDMVVPLPIDAPTVTIT
jgi:hypothetical protein